MNNGEMNIPEQKETADEIEERFRNNEVRIKQLELMTTRMKKYIDEIIHEMKKS